MNQVYQTQVYEARHVDRDQKLVVLRRRVTTLREEERRLGRLLITGKMSEEAYEDLRSEWQEKVRQAEADLDALEREATHYLDDLEVALLLLSQVSTLYSRLAPKEQATLLQIIAKRIIVRGDGEIIGHELHSPFAYLLSLKSSGKANESSGSVSGNTRSLQQTFSPV